MSKIRLEITKGEEIRHISHLDYVRLMERALRRAKLPVAYSEGFNPHMKMAFASALSLGVTSEAEYVDIELADEIGEAEFCAALSRQLPAGVVIKQAKVYSDKVKALMAMVNMAAYTIKVPPTADIKAAQQSIAAFNQAEAAIYSKKSPKGNREIDVKQYIVRDVVLTSLPDGMQLDMDIRITPTGSVKPSGVLSVLVDDFGLAVKPDTALICRRGLFVQNGSKVLSPLESGA